jgi:hypothetical protein
MHCTSKVLSNVWKLNIFYARYLVFRWILKQILCFQNGGVDVCNMFAPKGAKP